MLNRSLKEHIFKPLSAYQVECAEQQRQKAHFDKCPICARGPDTAKRVNKMLIQLLSPEEIRKELKRIGRTLAKADNPGLFHHAINHHIYFCLHENFLAYRDQLNERDRERKENERLHRELSDASSKFCLESKELENEFDLDFPSESLFPQEFPADITDVVSEQISTSNNMGNPRIPLDKEDIKLDLRSAVPNLITNQIRIMEMEQQKYLRGEISHPPDMKALESILKNLKTLIGSSELTDIIED